MSPRAVERSEAHSCFWPRGKIIILLLVPACAGIGTCIPLLSIDGLPRGSDAQCHLVRSYEYEAALLDGQIPPRIAPDLANGYGYGIHKYYPPLLDTIILCTKRIYGTSSQTEA